MRLEVQHPVTVGSFPLPHSHGLRPRRNPHAQPENHQPLLDDQLIINADSGSCANCDPRNADRREYQARLHEQHGLTG
jgi:hypothetical protein